MQLNIAKKIITLIVVIIFFILDRSLKYIVRGYYTEHPLRLIGDVLTFTFAKNYYIAFSLPVLHGDWLSIVIIILIVVLSYMLWKARHEFIKASSIISIILGATSNLLDRISYGYVIDYLDLKYFTVFNLADAMITIGALILVCSIYFEKGQSPSIMSER